MCMQERDPAVQKKAYKILAYICEHRAGFMEEHFQDVLETVMAGKGGCGAHIQQYCVALNDWHSTA